jgi:CheY-like chemotaxis protein
VERSNLDGCSILVIEEEPFMARCLQVRLEGAGAKVYSAASAGEALHFVEQEDLSAAVLDHAGSARDGHRIPQRLGRMNVPLVFCRDDAGDDAAWPQAPVLHKPVNGSQLVQILCRLVRPQAETKLGSGAGPEIGKVA